MVGVFFLLGHTLKRLQIQSIHKYPGKQTKLRQGLNDVIIKCVNKQMYTQYAPNHQQSKLLSEDLELPIANRTQTIFSEDNSKQIVTNLIDNIDPLELPA